MYSTWSLPYFKLRNKYAEFSISAAARFPDEIIFSAGINHAQLLRSDFLRMDTKADWKAYPAHVSESQQSIDIGMELKLQKNIALMFDYFIPLQRYDTKNFRIGMNVQVTGRENRKHVSPRRAACERAITNINELKDGTLLVRLHTSENKIAAMKEAGFPEKAERTQRKQRKENQKIISAFKSQFTFCPVLFFFSDNSENVRDKKFSGVFLNDSLMPDPGVQINEAKKYFIAEFTWMEPDSGKYFSHLSHQKDSIGYMREVKNYYTPGIAGFYALIIRDENLDPLYRPFPFYAEARMEAALKNQEAIPSYPLVFISSWNQSYESVVRRLDNKLHRFYEKYYNELPSIH